MFCREELVFPLKGGNHGFGKLCPKGLDTLEIKSFCGALGSRCWEKVRDHVGQGYGKISQWLCTSMFCNAETPCPRVSCEVRVFVCELSTHLACLKIGVSRGCQDQLSHSPLIISQVSNQSPVISFPLGRVSLRSLLALPWIPFTNSLPHWFGTSVYCQASVSAQRLLIATEEKGR